MKKLTSERLGREGLAAWGVAPPPEDLDTPDIEATGEITVAASSSPETMLEDKQEKIPEPSPCHEGLFNYKIYKNKFY